MLLQEMTEDNNLIIELSMNRQKYEFPSKVIRKVNQSVLVEPIRINGKILSFNSSGGGITVSIYMIRDGKPPMLWKGVAVNSIREEEGTLYKISANGEGFEVNRRGAFRLFIGISGVAQLGTNRKAVDVIVKDVSESGFSFVGTEDMDNVINMPVRLVFADFNQNYSLMGIIVRKVVIGENKIVYGCRLGVRNANLEQYISQKQRQMLSMNRGNSAFQNKEMLEKALKEPGRADRTTQEDEPDDKNYKKKQIKNDGTVVCFDSGVPDAPEGSVYATVVTDNEQAGGIAAEHIYPAIKDKLGKGQVRVGEVNQDATSANISERGMGFINKFIELAKADGFTVAVVGNDFYVNQVKDNGDQASADVILEVAVPAQTTVELCATEASNIMNKDDTIAMFGSNQVSAEGVLTANQNLNKLGTDDDKIVAAGFDAGSVIKAAVKDGTLLGAVTQSPLMQGKISIETLAKICDGESVEDVTTDGYWYDSTNMDDEDISPNLYD